MTDEEQQPLTEFERLQHDLDATLADLKPGAVVTNVAGRLSPHTAARQHAEKVARDRSDDIDAQLDRVAASIREVRQQLRGRRPAVR